MSQFGDKVLISRPNKVKVCFQQCMDASGQKQAMNVDMALTTQRDWSGKTTFQLTVDEMSFLAAFFLQREHELNFSFHGNNHNKALLVNRKIKNGNEYLFFGIFEGGETKHYINLTKFEGFRVFQLVMSALMQHYQMDQSTLLTLLKEYYGKSEKALTQDTAQG